MLYNSSSNKVLKKAMDRLQKGKTVKVENNQNNNLVGSVQVDAETDEWRYSEDMLDFTSFYPEQADYQRQNYPLRINLSEDTHLFPEDIDYSYRYTIDSKGNRRVYQDDFVGYKNIRLGSVNAEVRLNDEDNIVAMTGNGQTSHFINLHRGDDIVGSCDTNIEYNFTDLDLGHKSLVNQNGEQTFDFSNMWRIKGDLSKYTMVTYTAEGHMAIGFSNNNTNARVPTGSITAYNHFINDKYKIENIKFRGERSKEGRYLGDKIYQLADLTRDMQIGETASVYNLAERARLKNSAITATTDLLLQELGAMAPAPAETAYTRNDTASQIALSLTSPAV